MRKTESGWGSFRKFLQYYRPANVTSFEKIVINTGIKLTNFK